MSIVVRKQEQSQMLMRKKNIYEVYFDQLSFALLVTGLRFKNATLACLLAAKSVLSSARY